MTHFPAVLDDSLVFPDPRNAVEMDGIDGLVAIGGDLSVPRLLSAYRSGVFPWTSRPITWWSPNPRAIIELDRFHVPRSVRRLLRARLFEVTFDKDFRSVIEGCAAPAPGRRKTWISKEFVEAYTKLHEAGYAHSVECWQHGRLVGGIYGVSVGGLFAGESMFHRVTGASKVALVHLVERLRVRGFKLFDIQIITPTTAMFGATCIPRDEYFERLALVVDIPVIF
ncbi:MAG: leucyl/phenylalanyl-tRNA--protein transferase [Verrucomicrobiae bacterium]|nr:leucyl/phenylalanyl-tRNA--protein transferase [Verrucomicrobiae bacterium]